MDAAAFQSSPTANSRLSSPARANSARPPGERDGRSPFPDTGICMMSRRRSLEAQPASQTAGRRHAPSGKGSPGVQTASGKCLPNPGPTTAGTGAI